MNRREWLEWRLQGVCASDAPCIMGESPWKTRDQLLQEKATGIDNYPENDNMRFGKENEEVARLLYEQMTDHIVFPDQKIIHPKFYWIRATLDGLDMDGKVMVEIKCAKKSDHILASKQKVPPKYFAQCQHQLLAKELDTMDYFSYHKQEGIIVKVDRDQPYIAKMFQMHKIFWEEVLELRHKLNIVI